MVDFDLVKFFKIEHIHFHMPSFGYGLACGEWSKIKISLYKISLHENVESITNYNLIKIKMKECLETINGIISDYVYGKIDAEGVKKRISEIDFSLCPLYSGDQHSQYCNLMNLCETLSNMIEPN